MKITTVTSQSLLLGLALVASGCGKKSSSSTTPTTGSTDLTDQTQQTMNGAQDSASAVNEDGSGSGAALRLGEEIDGEVTGVAHLLSDVQPTVTRTCTPGSDTATVSITLSGTGSTTATSANGNLTLTSSVTESGTENRVWTAPQGATAGSLGCDSSAKYASIKWSDTTVVNGLTLGVTTNATQKRSVVYNNSKKNVQKTVEADSSETGTRTITWGSPTVSSSSISVTKSIYYSVQRGVTYTNAAGTTTNFTATVAVASASPLTVAVTRSATAPYAIQTQVVNGNMTATKTDGSVVTLAFNNVTYNQGTTNANVCQPVSGTITGTSTPKGGTASTYTVTFGDTSVDSGVSITWQGQSPTEYDAYDGKDCDLARN